MRALLKLLDLVSVGSLVVAIILLVSGGFEVTVAGIPIRARGIANPVAFMFVAAGLRRLLAPVERDGLSRIGVQLQAGIDRHLGPGGERLRGWLAFRADALLFALLALWAVDRALAARVEVEGDGVGYYAYVRSPMMDRDLDFANEYRDHDPRQQWVGRKTPIGRTDNPFAVGPALFWAPAFGAAWAAASSWDRLGVDVALTGYSPPFVFATAGVTWMLGIAGLILLYRLLLAHYPRGPALWAAIGTALASPLAYYLYFAPFYSHVHSFFCVTLFLWALLRTPADASILRWALLGACAGLVAITRWQDAVFWALPALVLAAAVIATTRRRGLGAGGRELALSSVPRGVAFLAGVGVLLLPQLTAFARVYGFWFGIPQGQSFVDSVPRWLLPTLFSWRHGLYSWTPLLLLATIGLVVAALRGPARVRPWAWLLVVALGLQMYANACVSQWWAGAAFGARRFSSSVPLFALGLAELFRRTEERGSRRLLGGVVVLAIAWNHVLIRQWLALEIPHLEAIDPLRTLATGWRYLATGDLRNIIGDETMLAEALWRLGDLVRSRPLLVASSASLFAASLLRARALRGPRRGPENGTSDPDTALG